MQKVDKKNCEDNKQNQEPSRQALGEVRFVVGVGASAGGLEALRGFFAAIQPNSEACFVVVQHLSPQHGSMLSELIARETRLEVKDAVDGEKLRGKVVYITPPNRDIFIDKDKISLKEVKDRVGPKPSIDTFFYSLSEAFHELAMGVILSGTGTDGSHGVRAIKAAGGLALAQSPESAKYDGMPRAAISTGSVDYVHDPTDLASEVNELIESQLNNTYAPQVIMIEDQSPFHEIMEILRRKARVDFTNYKQNTIRRRIKRRMDTNRLATPEEYVSLLKRSDGEIRALYQDILINVTAFFRNPTAFQALRDDIRRILLEKPKGSTFRTWVAGCASGEEAYSLAVLISEEVSELKLDISVQVFATDIDEVAMSMARKGLYPETALRNVPEDKREKYYTRMDGTYHVKKFLREMVVFARHDLTCDPPFMRMDLISCRNLFIYFKQEMQNRVFRMFHYALNPNGILFMGRSESIGSNHYYFEVLDQNAKIYRRTNHIPDSSISFSSLNFDKEQEKPLVKEPKQNHQNLLHTVIGALAPNSVIVNEAFFVEQAFGKAREYLTFPEGEFSQLISRLLPAGLSEAVLGLLHRCKRKPEELPTHPVKTWVEGQERFIKATVSPLRIDAHQRYVIRFEEVKSPAALEREGRKRDSENQHTVTELEAELKATREHLQTVVEQQETANEELQALNEELHSSNEELQATNEELETSNEELQSTNEELTTLNEELNIKSSELLSLNDYLESVQNAIEHPLFVIDPNFVLTRFNRAASQVFPLVDSDFNKGVHSVLSRSGMSGAIEIIEKAMHGQKQANGQIETGERDYRVQVDPIIGSNRKLEGAVISFTENTKMLRAYQALREKDNRLQSIINFTPALVSMKDSQGRYILVNQRFCEVMSFPSPEAVIGKTDDDLFAEEVARRIRRNEFDVLRDRKAIKFEEEVMVGGQRRVLLSSKFPLVDLQNTVHSVCTISLDITERVSNEERLNIFRRVIASSAEGMAVFDRANGHYVASFANPSLERMLDKDPDSLINQDLQTILKLIMGPQMDEKSLESLHKQMIDGHLSQLEVQDQSGNAWFELRLTRIQDDQGQDRNLLMLLIDISEAKAKERTILTQREELLRAGKLTALGEMAAGIAHELNTPLNSIQGYADLLDQVVDAGALDDDTAKDVASNIHRTVENIASVITGLRSIARMNENEEKRNYEIQKIVGEAVQVCDYHLRNKGVTLSVDMIQKPLHAHCRPFQLNQVLINLINNAVDAVKKLEEKWIRVEVDEYDGQARVRVIDSGEGISPQLAEKIMTPFFTTKKEGTGLGLSLSQSIVRDHAGQLQIANDCRNTCFELILPTSTGHKS